MTGLRSAALMAALFWLAPAAGAIAADRPSLIMLEPQYDASASGGETAESEAADRRRLAMIAERLDERLRGSESYEVVDDPAVAAEIGRYNLGACGRCELMLGRKAGADQVLVVSVQKISSLLINLQVAVYRVEDGATLAAGVSVIHSNTDTDWRRAMDKIAETRLGLPKA